MVEKKLNFNQPILSVRRYSLTIPSQNVDERKIENAFPVIPRLHPYRSELNSGPVRNPGAVPFQWEQTPGRPKEQIKQQTENRNRVPPIAAELSPSSSSSDNKIEGGDCDCDDQAFVDGLDSVSRTESFLSSCNMSGLTGSDDLEADSSRRFSTDPQTRELMMDRFLPASKAMEAEKPQYEQSEEVKKEIVNQDKPAFWYRPTFAKSCSYYNDKEEKEESDHDHDHENFVAICCLLPRSCLKSSVCILNPVPAMNLRARLTMFPSRRIQYGSSSAGSSTDTENEEAVKPVVKAQMDKLKGNMAGMVEEIAQLESSLIEEKEVVGVHEDTKHTRIEGFGLRKKSFKTLQELLADEDRSRELDSTSCVEKTVYVDTTRPCSPNAKASSLSGSSKGNNVINTMRSDQTHMIYSSLEDFKKFNVNVSFGGEDLYLDSTSIKNMEASEEEAAKNVEKQLARATTLENSIDKFPKFPVPPPLPRSPSDSWLCRTLSSVSTKKASTPTFISRCSNKS